MTRTVPHRLIAIGDIHGELDKLNRLLNLVQPQDSDQFVFLGDYVDRGPDVKGTIDRLIQFCDEFPQTIFIRGNHDQMFMDVLVEKGLRKDIRLREICPEYARLSPPTDLETFLLSGGDTTLNSYKKQGKRRIPRDHIEFFDSTLLWWRYEQFVFVHAGIEEGIPMTEQNPSYLLWERKAPPGQDGMIHVVGHRPTYGEPEFEEGRYRLDTGAVYGQKLTACDVLTRHYWQVKRQTREGSYTPSNTKRLSSPIPFSAGISMRITTGLMISPPPSTTC